ncbi:AAA family ATPase [Chitinophaga rhizophila]|uniref:ATP-binding protein n=1 Tax=Chitinophaga rhizophila TaxID=2866212 RepID=A0ABS7GKH1_9BACT|nr:AAA family ATPase [Chitinophaga rhizophila]MBW8688223.1 ATP-binding protein [Chitinophaga rhizophila]
MEKISIQNFAGIQEMDFEFKSVNILIGPQGSGKSVTAKLHFFFTSFFQELIGTILKGEDLDLLKDIQEEKFLTFFPRDTWPSDNFKITYSIGEVHFAINKTDNQLQFTYSDYVQAAISKVKAAYEEEADKLNRISKNNTDAERIKELINQHIHESLSNNQFFIPAGRSYFANFQSNIFLLLKTNSSLDPLLIEFGANYEALKRIYKNKSLYPDKADTAFDEIIAEILSGDYIREDNEDYLVHKDKRKVNLSNASSGQQETLPLIIFLWVLHHGTLGGATIYIEEPEAHLFPNAQKAITQLLARVFNDSEHAFQIFVTTHSPYILSSFNNLLEAGRLAELMPDKARDIERIVPYQEQLKSGLLTAYSISNGKIGNLIDQETNLITQTELDNISNDIAIEFGKLLDIEF